jgi:dTDP-4-dehydrorhamnose reductase
MKIMVTGANGFTGQHLCITLADKGFDVHALGRGPQRIAVHNQLTYHNIELTSVRSVLRVFDLVSPDVVIHTAAMSKPDECDRNRAECLQNNVEVTRHLLEASQHFPVHFIHLSTDFIFGENGPHSENDVPAPLNFYGESKLMAEKLVQESGVSNTIIRPVFIYGPVWEGQRPSFIHWVKNKLTAGERIKVVTDQQRTPTYVYDLCRGIEQVLMFKKQGVYHLAGKDILSPYDMAVTVAQLTGLDSKLIIPVTSAEFPEPVQRAKKSGLKIDKAIAELDYTPHSFEEAARLSLF